MRIETIVEGDPAIEFVIYEKSDIFRIVSHDTPEGNDLAQAARELE